jgi:excisionase family DNA binding protein
VATKTQRRRRIDPADSEWLTQDQAAQLAKVSTKTIERWRLGGRLPFSKPGRKIVRIKRTDLDRLLLEAQP